MFESILFGIILCHSDQRFLRYKLQKFGDFPICCMENGLEDISCPPTWPPPQKSEEI